MRKRITKIVWGFLWIVLGIILAGYALGIIHISHFFEGWWTLFLIVPSVISILCNGFNIFPTIMLTAGALLLLECQGITIAPVIGKLIIPIILIVVGLNLVIKSLINPSRQIEKTTTKDTEYGVTFSSKKIVYPNKAYPGSELDAIFGGLTLDLRNAVLTEDVRIDCTAVFGGIDIYVPENVRVKDYTNALFGGVDNKYRNRTSEDGPIIYLNGIVLFGGITVK